VRKRHVVVLSEEERARLHTMIGRGAAPASALTHARILLKANKGEAGPGLDRRRHWGRAGGQPRYRGPGPHALGRGRAGGCAVP
jgi:hypothetical protein